MSGNALLLKGETSEDDLAIGRTGTVIINDSEIQINDFALLSCDANPPNPLKVVKLVQQWVNDQFEQQIKEITEEQAMQEAAKGTLQ